MKVFTGEETEIVDWGDHIRSDPAILAGKPTVMGTRLSVGFILELFAEGWTAEQVLEAYPGLTAESLRAVFAFAAETVKDLATDREIDFSRGVRGKYLARYRSEEAREKPAAELPTDGEGGLRPGADIERE